MANANLPGLKPVLIFSDPDFECGYITDSFSLHNYAPIVIPLTEFDIDMLPDLVPVAAVIHPKDKMRELEEVILAIHRRYPALDLPILGILDAPPVAELDMFTSLLVAPIHHKQVALRLDALTRLSDMEQEIGLRMTTLSEDFQTENPVSEITDEDNLSVLFIGKATPEFMVVVNALQDDNVDVVAAFTSFTGFDYLYEREFDAVVINALHSSEPAFTIAETMRKNAKLFHVPTLLLINPESDIDRDMAYEKGISDIIDASVSPEEISARMIEQANFHRTHKMIKKQFGVFGADICIDEDTGLYNRSFFLKHLTRLLKAKAVYDEPVSICLIRANPSGDVPAGSYTQVYQNLGHILKSIVRVQDLAGRLKENVFAVVLSGQTPGNLDIIKDRISSVLANAVLHNPETMQSMTVNFEVTMSDLVDQQLIISAA